MSDLKVVSTSYMQLEFKNSINFLCLKECIKQFVHLCNWELGAVLSLEVKIIKEPLRRQLLETKLFFNFFIFLFFSFFFWKPNLRLCPQEFI